MQSQGQAEKPTQPGRGIGFDGQERAGALSFGGGDEDDGYGLRLIVKRHFLGEVFEQGTLHFKSFW